MDPPGGWKQPYLIYTGPCEHGYVTRLILASSSPRRRLLLSAAGFEFSIRSPDVDEQILRDEEPDRMVVRLAGEKAIAAEARDGLVALGADTTVVLDGLILGKPTDNAGAADMLLSIAGRTHLVLTGWAIAADGTVIEDGFDTSLVSMRSVTREEADAYAESGEPLDKAGAYALQGEGARFVSGVAGSRSNVIGLPLKPIVAALRRAGIEPTR
ncbi:MAG: nucleoside triphosphate pyrophosphatase [Actinomycetota bacterium]|nr:nucleoside triphosphate pyrophosphatase [Actinomycetota bacterium]